MFIDIPGYEGIYKISEDGIILSGEVDVLIDNKVVSLPKVRKCYLDKNGYRRIHLRGNRKKTWGLHQLVALAFIGENPGKDYHVDHIDFNKENNNYKNLRYIKSVENAGRKNPNNKYKSGKDHHGWMKRGNLSKLSKKVGQYKNGILIEEYESLGECARKTGFNISNIRCVIHKTRQKTCHGFTFEYI